MARFVGREPELARLDSLLGRASNGEACFALLAGAAGVGKSTLLREFIERADTQVLTGSCLPLGEQGVPFAPVAEMFRALNSDPELREFVPAGLVRIADASQDSNTEPTSRTLLFQAFLDLVTQVAESAPTIVVIEDLHWADRSTRDLLSFLIPNLRTDPVLVVMSYRTDDVHRDHPLRPMLAELMRNQRVDHIDLGPFSASLVADQIETLTGHAPSTRTLADVMQRTQGNPYFVEQLVAADGLDGRTLPESLRELLLVRADVVSPAARRTLRILSVAEDPVDDESLARVAGLSVHDVRNHIREAVDRRLLDAASTGTRFAHALLREALYEDLLSGERAEFHAAFAEVITARLAGQWDKGHLLPELYANAADILMRLGRWDEAQDTIDEANLRFPTGGDGAVLTELAAERGDFEVARRLIDSRSTRNVFTDREQQGWPLVHLATLEVWEADHEAARRAVDAALEVTADLDGPIATSYALAVGCRCDADAAADARRRGAEDELDVAVVRCESLVKQIEDLLARPGPDNGWKREVGALTIQCEAELSRSKGLPDPDLWAAATQAWDEMRMPYHAAYARFRNAEAIFVITDHRVRAESLLNEAHQVATSLGARPLRELIESFARRARVDIGLPRTESECYRLTAREREVLATLTTGASNRQIASTLFISEKTASVHVSNIMRKLGVSNRGEAAALAHREGLVC